FYFFLRFFPNIYCVDLKAGMNQLLNPAKYYKNWKQIYEERDKYLFLKAGSFPHEKERIGPGPQILKTQKGWLFIYHATGEVCTNVSKVYGLTEKIKRAYSISAALLDLENPKEVLCRTKHPIYIPSLPHELSGNDQYPVDIPGVIFPTGAIIRKEKLLLYCGAGDKYMILLSCNLDSLVNYLIQYCSLG
ncbi:MAG: hypothetical protein ACFFCQ_05190, partial [Promethearchaeota archaeon]